MLLETQSALGRFLLLGDDSALGGVFVSDRIAAKKRLMIHRNNVMGSLVAALGATYPMVERALGRAGFRAVAARYVAVRPPAEARLSAYGAAFASYLAAQDLTAMPFVPALARLEWARQEAFFAADEPALDLAALRAVPQAQYSALKLRVHASARLLALEHGAATVWQALHDNGHAADGALLSEREHLLVLRRDGAVVQGVLTPADYAFVRALDAGATLEEAAGEGLSKDDGFDLQAALVAHLSGGTFTSFGAEPWELP
jgi:hypothetical protein